MHSPAEEAEKLRAAATPNTCAIARPNGALSLLNEGLAWEPLRLTR